MAKSAAPERVNLGNRLFRVGARFYIRVGVPRDLREALKAEGKSAWEVFEPLEASDRRAAERACRQRGAEIDADFLRRRTEREQAERNIRPATAADIERLALLWYAEAEKEGNEADLASSAPITDEVLDDEAAEHADVERAFRRALARNDYSLAEPHAEMALVANGLRLDKGTAEYRMLCQSILRGMVENVAEGRRRSEGDFTGRKADPLFNKPLSPAPATAEGGISLEELIKRYERERGVAWSGKTRDGYALIFRSLKELLGKDKPVKIITREDCRRVREILLDVAPNYTKLPATRGKTMEEAARISRELNLPRRKPESVNSYLNNLAALFNFAEQEQYVERHPAKALMVPTTTKKKDKRKPFSADQLKAIFDAPLYTSGAVRGGKFFVPLLSLWTGMRLNECCQLLIEDVRYEDNVPVVIIREDSEDGTDDKRVKTEAGERYVPVHPELERVGFLAHWRAMKEAGEKRLFPDLPKGANGYYSDPFSKWFSRFLDDAKAKADKTSFHSFRHNYRDALREADISTERVKALGGWANTETQED